MFNGQLQVWREANIVRGRLTLQTPRRGPVSIEMSAPIQKSYAKMSGLGAATTLAANRVKNSLCDAAKYWPEASLVHPKLLAFSNRLFTDLNCTSSRAQANAKRKVERLREMVERGSGSAADVLYCLKRFAERELDRRRGMRMMMGYTPIIIGYNYRNAYGILQQKMQKLDGIVKQHGASAVRRANPVAFGAWLYAKNRAHGATFQKPTLQRIGAYVRANGIGSLKRKHPASYGMLSMAGKLSAIAKEQRRQTMVGGPVRLMATPRMWMGLCHGDTQVGSLWSWAEKAVSDVASTAGSVIESGAEFMSGPIVQAVKPLLPALDAVAPGLGTGLMAAATVAPMVSDGIDAIKAAKSGDQKAISDVKIVKQLAAAGVPKAVQTVALLQVSQEVMNKTQAAAEKEMGVVPGKGIVTPGMSESLYNALSKGLVPSMGQPRGMVNIDPDNAQKLPSYLQALRLVKTS